MRKMCHCAIFEIKICKEKSGKSLKKGFCAKKVAQCVTFKTKMAQQKARNHGVYRTCASLCHLFL